MAIEIQKGIPITNRKFGGRSEVGIAVRAMGVGDSFVLPISETSKMRGGALAYWKATTGRKFKTRIVIENGVKLIRVWRTE